MTSINQLDLSKKYSYTDYLSWQFEEALELIRGRVVRMSPAPGTRHQKISLRLGASLLKLLQGGPCQVFIAPFDVFLMEGTTPRNAPSCSNPIF
ncbi:MAG: Uma2 family endonuclease, partial [Cytophagales bacterium]|nr:Uma2 family endonuclease [Cytophagales bacterium]